MTSQHPNTKLDSGVFSLADFRSIWEPQQKTVADIKFCPPHTSPPNLILGLKAIDASSLRIGCDIDKVTKKTAEVAVQSWDQAELYNAGYSWMTLPEGDLDIQFGRFDTREGNTPGKPQTTTSITFDRPYPDIPKVITWLEGGSVQVGTSQQCRLFTCALDVTANGFTLQVDSWDDTQLLSGVAGWVAFSANRKDIRAGTFRIDDIRKWNEPRQQNSSYVPFGGKGFPKAPKVFTALFALDLDNATKRRLRLNLSVTDVSLNGMNWHLDTWEDSIVYTAGGVYIAYSQ